MDGENIKYLLGIKIKEQRNRLKLTQEEFSELIGISQRQVSLIELGKSFPKPETLSKISQACSCKTAELFDFEMIKSPDKLKDELLNLIEGLSYEKLKTLYVIGRNI